MEQDSSSGWCDCAAWCVVRVMLVVVVVWVYWKLLE